MKLRVKLLITKFEEYKISFEMVLVMHSFILQNELSKYGIKPGLGKRKGKQLLRHIYDQLHPFEDKTTLTRKVEEKPKLKNMGHKKNGASSSRPDKKSAVSADSDES